MKLRACLVSPTINERMVRVQNLLAPPSSLLRPDVAVRAVLAARRAPSAAGIERAPAAAGVPLPAGTSSTADGLAMTGALAEADVHRSSR